MNVIGVFDEDIQVGTGSCWFFVHSYGLFISLFFLSIRLRELELQWQVIKRVSDLSLYCFNYVAPLSILG